MASNRLNLVQNNVLLDRININSNEWHQRASGFAIELNVHHHLQHHSFQRFFYMEDNDVLSWSGMLRFLTNVFFPEQTQGEFVDGNGIQLTLPNPAGVSGSLSSTRTVYSLHDLVFFVFQSVSWMRNQNHSMKFVPVQMDLEVLANQSFRRVYDSVILDAMDDDEDEYVPFGWYLGRTSVSASVQALKEVRVEGSSSVDCSICLESVGVGLIASQAPCAHIFHTNCIRPWLQNKPSCPLCRAPIG